MCVPSCKLQARQFCSKLFAVCFKPWGCSRLLPSSILGCSLEWSFKSLGSFMDWPKMWFIAGTFLWWICFPPTIYPCRYRRVPLKFSHSICFWNPWIRKWCDFRTDVASIWLLKSMIRPFAIGSNVRWFLTSLTVSIDPEENVFFTILEISALMLSGSTVFRELLSFPITKIKLNWLVTVFSLNQLKPAWVIFQGRIFTFS